MKETVTFDGAKGELKVIGHRHLAMNAEALSRHLDALVGVQVAEVIMDNHENRLGKEDVAKIREERPQASIREIIDLFLETESLSGIGVARITLSDNPADPIILEISNPIVIGTSGASKALMFSYWAGALSALLSRELEVRDVLYDQDLKVLRCQIAERLPK